MRRVKKMHVLRMCNLCIVLKDPHRCRCITTITPQRHDERGSHKSIATLFFGVAVMPAHAKAVAAHHARSAATLPGWWHSPFAHGQGNSWHSIDSLLMLSLFCYFDLLAVIGVASGVWVRTRSRRRSRC